MNMAPPNTAPNGQIQSRPQNGQDNQPHPLIRMLTGNGMKQEIARALPKHVTAERMARVALTALRTTKDLLSCTPESFLACIMQASQLGLEVNTPLGHAYLIPRKNRKHNTIECTLIIGYQGLIDLARRSGQVRGLWAFPVYQGDHFKVSYGLKPTVEHEPRFDLPRTKETLLYVYAAAKLTDNEDPVFVVLTKAEIEAYRKRGASGAGASTPWDTDYEAMSLKTGVRRLYRWLPKSSEMARAAEVDEGQELGKASAFDPEVEEALKRGAGLTLPEDTQPETLATEDVPETAKHAQEIETGAKEPAKRGRARAADHDPLSGEVAEKDEPPVG